MAARKRSDKNSGSNAGTVFWLSAIVIVLFIFALNWGKVQETLARTNFHEIVKTQTAADKVPPAAAPKDKSEPSSAQPSPSILPKAPPKADAPSPAVPAQSPIASNPKSAEPTARPEPAAPEAKAQPQAEAPAAGAKPASVSPKVASQPSAAAKSRAATLYFVRIDDDGAIVRQEVRRQVPVSDSPLLDSLAALLKGPSEDEIRKKLISLVPQGTKLLSAQVRGSTAVLNFNEAFMYNHYGIEGYAGQLKQVVYTATAFPTVQDVQILIEGERHDYLGGEGVYIGRPLSRNSF
jgi:germination protein M